MPPRKGEGIWFKGKFDLRWILIVLVLGVFALLILAFISPVSQGGQGSTPTPSVVSGNSAVTPTPSGDLAMTQTAEVDELPPTPEEIGYTDGIIFMSTLLILILLVGTLRETLRRKGR
jgi:hypothetical protein